MSNMRSFATTLAWTAVAHGLTAGGQAKLLPRGAQETSLVVPNQAGHGLDHLARTEPWADDDDDEEKDCLCCDENGECEEDGIVTIWARDGREPAAATGEPAGPSIVVVAPETTCTDHADRRHTGIPANSSVAVPGPTGAPANSSTTFAAPPRPTGNSTFDGPTVSSGSGWYASVGLALAAAVFVALTS